MTDLFYQPAVQLLGYWHYVFQRLYGIAAVNIWNHFCLFFACSCIWYQSWAYCRLPIARRLALQFDELWFDHWVPTRNVKFTRFLFTGCFKCRASSSKQRTGQLYIYKFLICSRPGAANVVARKDHVGLPRACSKNYTSMIIVFSLTNINSETIEGKSSKIMFQKCVSN